MTLAVTARSAVGSLMRALPGFRGKGRLAAKIHGWFGTGGIEEIRMRGGHMMRIDLRSLTEYRTFYSGTYDDDIISDVISLIEPDTVVFDIGANIGFHSVPLALACDAKHAALISVEPMPTNVQALRHNLELNGVGGVRVIPCALGKKRGVVQLVLREDFVSGADTGNASIAIDDGRDAMFRTLNVEMRTLDEVCEALETRVDVIRMDIEGSEIDLLQGGEQTVRRCSPIIVGEFNEWFLQRRSWAWPDVHKYLDALGYAVFYRRRGRWTLIGARPIARRGDVLCVPRNKIDAVRQRIALDAGAGA
jgi:FkbM family methyltransferase